MTLRELLNILVEKSRNLAEQGAFFEEFIVRYLQTDPQYASRLEKVWRWAEWPDRFGPDCGIDLVARERDTGAYWAIQCKFYDPQHTLQKEDIDSFFTASGKSFATQDNPHAVFSQRLIITTTDRWSVHAEEAIQDQIIPVTRISLKNIAESPIDWGQFLARDEMHLRLKKKPRPHQEEAIKAVVEGFREHDRGKLTMACGTGKTFTALRIMEKAVPQNGKVLFLAPSISLIGQSLREWTAEACEAFDAFVVCSDTKVGRENEDIRIPDLAYPATTDHTKLVEVIKKLSGTRRVVVFSTYQSIDVIIAAQKEGFGVFDLIICDEAHRTTGLSLPNENASAFVKVHDDQVLQGKKRLYMTATPRIFAEHSKTRAAEEKVALYSMDDEKTYGREFYRLSFGDAVVAGLLSDYKVIIVAVNEAEMAKLTNRYNQTMLISEKDAIDIGFATKIIGTWKALSKNGLMQVDESGTREAAQDSSTPMRRAVAFSRTIKDSKQITEAFNRIVDAYRAMHEHGGTPLSGMVDPSLRHVDGGMNAMKRHESLEWLRENPDENECRVLSNARCLSEGIDVPALDAVIFFDTRDSIVDIVQSVGRVMRKAEGKEYGYIILPVCIPSYRIHDYNVYIDRDPQFKGIWKVLKALRAHDETLVDEAEFRRKINVITDPTRDHYDEREGYESAQLHIEFPAIPITDLRNAVYAIIPKKLGDREYWSEWASNVADIARRLSERIKDEIETHQDTARKFDQFIEAIKTTLNPSVERDDAIEMLTQHVLTLPIFQALFSEHHKFPESNVVGKSLQNMIVSLGQSSIFSETGELSGFYQQVRDRIRLAKSDKSKQDIIRNLYDTFFHNAFPRMAERLGIVYTPVEVVDFIIKSADHVLKNHFGKSLSDPDVHILDPFAGTGTFLVRLVQSGVIPLEHITHQYMHNMHANEIVLLAYYIATVNIETAYHSITQEYQPFTGMVLADTFQLSERKDMIDDLIFQENNERANHQRQQPIMVIIGNPPYSARQKSANDNNQNAKYPILDSRIAETYAKRSKAKGKMSIYDSYIRAIRWASDRIGSRGIVAFVTNGSFINSQSTDGLRLCLADEYSHLYIFNSRGNRHRSGEQSRKEGGESSVQVRGSQSPSPSW